MFLANANLVFNSDAAVGEIKKTVIEQEKKIDELHRQLGKRIAELEWASKKLQSLDFKAKKTLIKSELGGPSVQKKCALLGFNRSSYYYQSTQLPQRKLLILREIDNIYTEIPFFGYRKVYQQLIENGLKVGVNQVANYMKELGLKVIYPSRKIKTTLANLAHKKYPYLLRYIDINKPNQVWSTDITYIRVEGGFVYLAAVIDWYSKAILSHKISNTMDESLVLDVLNMALEKHGVNEYITFYNHKRFHQSLKYQKPMNVYNCPGETTLKLAA